jgi:hypothetical protein
MDKRQPIKLQVKRELKTRDEEQPRTALEEIIGRNFRQQEISKLEDNIEEKDNYYDEVTPIDFGKISDIRSKVKEVKETKEEKKIPLIEVEEPKERGTRNTTKKKEKKGGVPVVGEPVPEKYVPKGRFKQHRCLSPKKSPLLKRVYDEGLLNHKLRKDFAEDGLDIDRITVFVDKLSPTRKLSPRMSPSPRK